jgi:hypothetical protein
MNTPDRNSKPAKVKTILILDGDVLVRMPVVQFLRDCGYQAVEAANTDWGRSRPRPTGGHCPLMLGAGVPSSPASWSS